MSLNILLILSFLLFYCCEWLRKERILRKIFFDKDLFSFFTCNFRRDEILFLFERDSFGGDSNLLPMDSNVFDCISEFIHPFFH